MENGEIRESEKSRKVKRPYLILFGGDLVVEDCLFQRAPVVFQVCEGEHGRVLSSPSTCNAL